MLACCRPSSIATFAARTASGPCFAIFRAIDSASAFACPASTTVPTIPSASAAFASNFRAVKMSSFPLLAPIEDGMTYVKSVRTWGSIFSDATVNS